MVTRDINLQEKRTYAPIPMFEEPYFTIPAEVAPPVQATVVATPIVDVESSGIMENKQVAQTPEISETPWPNGA